MAATPAIAALERAGVAHVVHRYAVDPRASSFGADAAAKLAMAPERIFKTLVVSGPSGTLALALVPVTGTLDLRAAARSLGWRSAALARPAEAQRATGSVVGGIAPLGHRRALPTVIDRSATGHGTVLVSAGRRGLEVELAPEDLVAVTAALLAPIGSA